MVKKQIQSKKKVPGWLQGILWSADVADLDLEKNKSYIINQILSLGRLEELRWLFETYSKKILREVFVNQSAKIYSFSSFNYSKNILLELKNKKLLPEKYVKTLPRRTR